LLNLPEEKQAQIAEWLLSGIPYHRAREMILNEFAIELSIPVLSRFWETVCAPALIAKRQRAVSTADDIAAEAEKTPGKFDKATIDALKQKAFELSISPGADPRDVKSLFMLVLKSRDQEIAERDLEFQREQWGVKCQKLKLELTKMAGTGKDKKVSSADLVAKVDEVMGLKKKG
jgi:hypothetical protein